MFIVGIDVAKRSHEAVIINDSGNVVKKAFNFTNDFKGFSKLLEAIHSVSAEPTDFIIGMESTAHYWLALYSNLRKVHYTVRVLNPIQSNALRGLYIRQIKNDERDCFIIAEVIRFGRHPIGELPPPKLYELRELCRARTFIMDMVADLKRKVIALLDQVFPEYETIFANIFGDTSSELLRNCSTPEEILAIDIKKLAKLLEAPSRKRFSTKKAHEIQEVAATSFGIVLGFDSMSFLIKQHIEHIQYTEKQIDIIDDKIATIFSQFNTYLTTIPGIGLTLGATIFSEIGDITRFPSSAKLAAFAGIDPSIQQSGEFMANHNHMSKRGSPYLRRALWQASTLAIMRDSALKTFFDKKRVEGKSYMTAIGRVTKKLTNIIFAVLRDLKPYYDNDKT